MTTNPPPDFDLYEELGIPTDASPRVIEAAWRRLVKQNHPDHRSGPDATSRTVRLNCARKWLANPERRRQYDQERRFRRPNPLPRNYVAPAMPVSPVLPVYDGSNRGVSATMLLTLFALVILGASVFLGVGSGFVPMALMLLGATLALFYGLLLLRGSS